jgi:hypothetical protein
VSKSEFIQNLKDKNIFWSYDKKSRITDSIVIEHTLVYADVDDIQQLFKIYGYDEVREVWEKSVIPDARYYKLNYYLGLIFFEIKNIESFIKKKSKENSRYERIKKFASKNT